MRRRLVVAGICVAVVVATVVVVDRSVEARPASSSAGTTSGGTGGGLGSDGRVPPVATTRTAGGSNDSTESDQVPARPSDEIDGLLERRAAAIRSGDRAGWLAGLVPASGDPRLQRFRTAQTQVFDRVRSLRPVAWSYQVSGGYPLSAERRIALGGVAWLADVQLDYQLTADGPTVQRQQFLTIVSRDGGWSIAADTDGATGRDVWDLGPISTAGSPRCLVVGARARRAQITRFAAECGGPARTVDGAWGRAWPRRTVLTVPNTLSQLAVLLGRSGDTAGLERTAAVTVGPAAGAADAVLINGAAFDELSAVGRRVVLTHELVHVATRATGSRSAPTWLSEGYADYVAYAHTGLSAQEVAGEALAAVQAGRLPTGLPATNDFNAAGDQAAAAYGFAWVAVGLIAAKTAKTAKTPQTADAERAGAESSRDRLRAFYQQVAAPGAGAAGLDAALAEVGLGGTPAFVGVWQARLRQLAE